MRSCKLKFFTEPGILNCVNPATGAAEETLRHTDSGRQVDNRQNVSQDHVTLKLPQAIEHGEENQEVDPE